MTKYIIVCPKNGKAVRTWSFADREHIIALREAFKKATGLTLLCNYHVKDNCYDEVDGFWFHLYEDEHYIETVLIPTNGRYSVCVSTQIGCAMNCAFCRTAKMGFIRNLEAGEILEEIIRVNAYLKETGEIDADGKPAQVTNIIFMGMGEPLNNLENVHRTCCTLHNQKLFNLGRKKMTVSTSGVVIAFFYPFLNGNTLQGPPHPTSEGELMARLDGIFDIAERVPVNDSIPSRKGKEEIWLLKKVEE